MSVLDPQLRIATLEHELAWAHLKIQALTEQLRQQRIKMLGPRSETLSDLQLQLLADEEPGATREEVEAEAGREPITSVPKRERKPHPGRQRLPENLPRVEEVIRCAELTCGTCGGETAVIGYDESEQLDVEPARYFVRVTKREKRACRVLGTAMGTPAYMSPAQWDGKPGDPGSAIHAVGRLLYEMRPVTATTPVRTPPAPHAPARQGAWGVLSPAAAGRGPSSCSQPSR